MHMSRRKWKGSSTSKSYGAGDQSSNWSGYAVTKTKKNSYSCISGYWIVPIIRPSRLNLYSAAWIGIDGFSNNGLIQTGTGHDIENGKPSYYAWWEILPAPETIIPHPVYPGDHMYAKITRLHEKKWCILLVNKTRGWVFKKRTTYTGPGTSAEWIMEAPSINGKIVSLAKYGKTCFYRSRVNGKNPMFQATNRITMVQNGCTVSTPSLPGKTKDNFSVSYGSERPRPPKTYNK